MVCRSKERGELARQKIAEESSNENVFLLVCDCSLEADTRAMWDAFCAAAPASAEGAQPQLDVLVCNAGVLLNEKTLTRRAAGAVISLLPSPHHPSPPSACHRRPMGPFPPARARMPPLT